MDFLNKITNPTNPLQSDHAAGVDKAIGAAGSGAAGSATRNIDELQNHINRNGGNSNHGGGNGVPIGQASTSKAAGREYISSPGYDTSSSTAPASSPDPCEYTYEGAIQDYKQRVQRASSNGNGNANGKANGEPIAYPTRRGSKIEDRLSGFEVTSPSGTQEGVEKQKVDVPKVDISKRKEIFEQAKAAPSNGAPPTAPKVVLRDRLTNGNGTSNGSSSGATKPEVKRLSGDITSIRDRMQSLEQQRNAFNSSKSVDVPVPPLKQRLNSLQQSVTKEEHKKPMVALIDARQLEIMRGEEERMRQQQKEQQKQQLQATVVAPPALIVEEPPVVATNDDSGIQEDTNDELQQQQQQLNAAIAALALEERQLEEAANAVNQIEAEFDELTDLNPSPLPHSPAHPSVQAASAPAASSATPTTSSIQAPNQPAAAPPLRDMEFSVSSTNNFIESAKLSPSDVDVVAASAVSVPKSGPTPPPTSTPTPPNPSSPTQNTCNLRRKPSNEMVHHRNLLKMFKETFQNDDDLKEVTEPTVTSPGQFSQVFDFTKQPVQPPQPVQPVQPPQPILPVQPPAPVAASSPVPTQIPRPLGKPPMSPKAVRLATSPKIQINSANSPTSPTAQQFSINGRVEIFNSRQLEKPPTPPAPPKRSVKIEQPPREEAAPLPEVVMCAPPMTIVNPDELPKPNTVKALSNCFTKTDAVVPTPITSPIMSPRALPRSRIPQITPPASPKPIRRAPLELSFRDEVDRSSGDYAPVMGETKAIVHSPPPVAKANHPRPTGLPLDPLAPNDALYLHSSSPCELAPLKACSPNESSLFKMVSSRPTSPSVEVALCQQFLEREAPKDLQLAPEDRVRLEKMAVEEVPCDKIDATKSPLRSTGFQNVSEELVKKCDGKIELPKEQSELEEVPSKEDIALCAGLLDCLAPAQEPICDIVDVKKMPVPATGFQDVSELEVKRCDAGGKSSVIQSARPGSPIGSARAAHSKALMDTCEKIIAEERLASSQMMKTSLPEAPSTPQLGRKSKIPIPKPCCISASGTDSISRAGYAPTAVPAPTEQPLIARTHLVETEIKVKEISPPSSPKPQAESPASPAPPVKEKKTKNIFDFLRRNFGHHEEPQPHPTLNETLEKKVVLTSTRSGVDVVNADEFVRVDNSKFYVASEEEDGVAPPPLPKTPAPVNIEIRKTITTDEILEENTTEQALTQEISDLLDDEIMKLEAAGAASLKK